jgi:hypothetical protein
MKKIFLSILLCSQYSQAGWFDSFALEPSLACAVVGAGAYQSAPSGKQLNEGAIGCAVGAGVMYLINSYYDSKIGANKNQKISDLEAQIKIMNDIQAQKIIQGDPKTEFAMKVRECAPAQVLPNGSVLSPHCTDKLITPSNALEVGY